MSIMILMLSKIFLCFSPAHTALYWTLQARAKWNFWSHFCSKTGTYYQPVSETSHLGANAPSLLKTFLLRILPFSAEWCKGAPSVYKYSVEKLISFEEFFTGGRWPQQSPTNCSFKLVLFGSYNLRILLASSLARKPLKQKDGCVGYIYSTIQKLELRASEKHL